MRGLLTGMGLDIMQFDGREYVTITTELMTSHHWVKNVHKSCKGKFLKEQFLQSQRHLPVESQELIPESFIHCDGLLKNQKPYQSTRRELEYASPW